MCDLSGRHCILVMIDEVYILDVRGSEIVFLSVGLDDHSSIILRYFQALVHLTYKLQVFLIFGPLNRICYSSKDDE